MRFTATPIFLAASLLAAQAPAQQATVSDPATRQLAREVFKQLIEINSTDSVGSTTAVAEAMRKRLLDAGFPASDVVILGPNPRKGNLVARYRGKPGSTLKPVLLLCHDDVVEAKREDWTTDPFVFTEKDGYFYGRGTQDMKDSDAAMVVSFLRLKKEGYVPDRDLILALTADEEGGKSNGIDWLLQNHRDLVDADFVINPDSGGVTTRNGKPLLLGVEETEKLYADYHVTATNPGGHSSLPTGNNAIYHVANALVALEHTPFPIEFNTITREEFETRAKLIGGEEASDLRAALKTPPDKAAIARLSAKPVYNSTMRTTCVATMLTAGHAPNALPARAQANINCRILPGHSQEEIRQDLIRLFNDPTLSVLYTTDAGEELPKGTARMSPTPSAPKPAAFQPLRLTVEAMWPGLTIFPEMEIGASDSIYTMAAGMPSYGFNGMSIEDGDERAHGKDERLGVESYYTGVEFQYRYLKALGKAGE